MHPSEKHEVLKKLHLHPNCQDCPLNHRPFTPPQTVFLTQYPLMFVGQAPGETETFTDQPFTGPAGKTHYRICMQAGLQKQNLYHTNTCLCWPPADRKPTWEEINCCLPRLKEEIHQQQPKLLVALGESAMNCLTGKEKISSHHGRFYPLRSEFNYPQGTVLCALHPSFIMRQRQWIPSAVRVYMKIHDFFTYGLQEEPEPEFLLDPPLSVLEDYLHSSDPDQIWAVDTETTGLDIRQDRIIGHSFSKSSKTALALKYTPNDPRWNCVKQFLQDPNRLKCWQNGSFDTEIARSHQIHDQGFAFDTRLAQQLLDSDLPSDLDFLRGQYTNIPPYKPPKRKMKDLLKWSSSELLTYAAWDAITTYQVMLAQQPLLTEQELRLMQGLLIPLVRAIGRTERKGCLINLLLLAIMYSRNLPRLEEWESKFPFNPRSPKQVCEYFNIKTSGKKELEHHIKRGHSQAELMEQLLDYRQLDRLTSTYLKGLHNQMDSNNRVYPHYKIEGTGTGRLASEKPNQQNVPDEMRVIWIADPGHVLINADYSQLELWVGAAVSGESQMLQDLQQGKDIHFISCKICFPQVKLVYNDRSKDFTPQQVRIAKAVVFGTFYGRTARSIAIEFGVTVHEAEQWQNRLLNHYPGLKNFKQKLIQEVDQKGYLTTPFGRRRKITRSTQAFNFPVQSTASDITLQAFVLSDQAGLWVWGTVHDSIMYHPKEEELLDYLQQVDKIFRRPIPQLDNLRLNADYKIGFDWYHMKTVNPNDHQQVKEVLENVRQD